MNFENLTMNQLKQVAIAMIAALLFMTLAAVYFYPENLQKFGRPSFIWTISLLIAYLIFSTQLSSIGSKMIFNRALDDGTKMGMITGFIWMIHITIEYFVSIPKVINGPVTLVFMAVLFVCFGVSAYLTMQKTKQAASAILSGVWCAMFSILILFIYGFILNFVFMTRLSEILKFDEEFKTSGMPARSFAIHNTLESGGTHLLAAPIIAFVFSLLAIGIAKINNFFLTK